MDLWNYVLGMYECYTNNKFISITLSLISLYVAVTSVIHYYKYKLEGYQRFVQWVHKGYTICWPNIAGWFATYQKRQSVTLISQVSAFLIISQNGISWRFTAIGNNPNYMCQSVISLFGMDDIHVREHEYINFQKLD